MKPRLLIPFFALAFITPPVNADNYTVLHNFGFTPGDGSFPGGSLIQSGNTLYALTQKGGTLAPTPYAGNGTIFSFDLTTNNVSVLHSFAPGEGSQPLGSLTQIGNLLYGMNGGEFLFGHPNVPSPSTIFSFDPNSNAFATIHTFVGGASDGSNASGSLLRSGTSLYGMTPTGGANNDGILFRLDTPANTYNVLHHFAGTTTDGANPYGSLIQSGNLLYGMTLAGGANALGSLFAFDITSNTISIRHSFAGGATDGFAPFGSLVQSGNILYGMTSHGGSADTGTIFAYNLLTNTETILHSFAGNDGVQPYGSMIFADGTLYGMTHVGGSDQGGTVFAFNPASQVFTTLHAFLDTPFIVNGELDFDGGHPTGDLLLTNGTLYGLSAFTNDILGVGTLFSITVPEPNSLFLLAMGASVFAMKRRTQNKLF